MINNVSKTINNDNKGNKTESLTGNGDDKFKVDECISDFPINRETSTNKNNNNKNAAVTAAAGKNDKNNKNNNNNNKSNKYNNNDNNKANFADASKMRKSTILREESAVSCELTAMSMEKISPQKVTTTTTTKTTAAIAPTKRISKETKNRIQSSSNTTKKSLELWKNKCPAYEYNKISSKRATLANTTSAFTTKIYGLNQSTTTKTTNFNRKSSDKIQCELLEKQQQNLPKFGTKSKTLGKTSSSVLNNLAEQKAKLRSDFFKDINQADKKIAKGLNTETDKQQQQKAAATVYKELKQKRLLKRCTNLKLKIYKQPCEIEKEEIKPISIEEKTVLQPASRSLIEARKLELESKFQAQTAIKTTIQQQEEHKALQEFRRVAELVKKFDKKQIKMIVNPNNKEGEHQVSDMYTLKPIAHDQRHSSPLSDEGCNLGQSPYSTDDEHENDNNASSTTIENRLRIATKSKDKVARSASSDSALGLEVDDPMDASTTTTTTRKTSMTPPPTEQQQKQQQRRMTLTVTDLPLRPALLPLAEPTTLPDSPTPELQQTLQTLLSQTSIPSKVLLEERVVEIPEEPQLRSPIPISTISTTSSMVAQTSHGNSRRESAQSGFSDYPFGDTTPGIRYVRTPSVVVSDYSDDVMCGITLEEIEYFRKQRLNRRSSLDIANIEGDIQSDVSASSSCSNLYYCGSTISALDGAECLVNGLRVQLERKISDCSTCSTSGNEDETSTVTSTSSSAFTLTEDNNNANANNNNNKDIADLLAAQHLSSKRPKKVGACGANKLDLYDNRI